MKKEFCITILLVIGLILNVLAQNVLTYTGPYSPPENFYNGKVTYQYILVNGEKIKHGSYHFVAENYSETGSFNKGKKTGLWTQRANSATLRGDYTNINRLNTKYITKDHNYIELVVVKTLNYSNGVADGAYNDVFTYTQKWWYPQLKTTITIKKRSGVYSKGKRVSQTGSVYKEGIKYFYFNVNYKNDEVHGNTVFEKEDLKTECFVKNGQIISLKQSRPDNGKIVENISYKPDSVIFRKFHDPNGIKLYGNGSLYVDTIQNTNILRYNIINVDTAFGLSISPGFGDDLINYFSEDTIGNGYVVNYRLDQYPIHKIDLEKIGFLNLKDEFNVFSQYFSNRKDKLSLYHIEKEYYDKGAKVHHEKKYGTHFTPVLTENKDTMYETIDTIWHEITEAKFKYLVAIGDTTMLLMLKKFPQNNYAIFNELLWSVLRRKPDSTCKYYNYIVSNNNQNTDNEILNAKEIVSYFKTTNCPDYLLNPIANSLEQIIERRFAYNKKYLVNDSVIVTQAQIWSASSIKQHLKNRDIYQNWENDFYYELFDSIGNVCPVGLNIPTIEDIEYNTQSELPLNELIPFEKETYLTLNEADQNQNLGLVLVVKEFDKNKYHFYSVSQKRIVDKDVHSAMVRCVKNKK